MQIKSPKLKFWSFKPMMWITKCCFLVHTRETPLTLTIGTKTIQMFFKLQEVK